MKVLSSALCAASVVLGTQASSAQSAQAGGQETLDVQACASAFEQAQRLRNETKYLAANQQVRKCANPMCGAALLQECSRLYEELQSAIPTVVFSARDAAKGSDLSEVAVTIDGQPGVDQIDGKAIPIDPGNHTFKFTAAGYPPIERRMVIRDGEKFRQVAVTFSAEGASETAPQPATTSAPAPAAGPAASSSSRPIPVATWVLGGIGVAGLATGAILRVVGSGQYDDLKSSCSPACSDSEIDRVKTKYTLSTVALGVGGAALAASVVILLAAPRESSETPAALVLQPTLGGGATAQLRGVF